MKDDDMTNIALVIVGSMLLCVGAGVYTLRWVNRMFDEVWQEDNW